MYCSRTRFRSVTAQRYIGAHKTRSKYRRCSTVRSQHMPPADYFPVRTDIPAGRQDTASTPLEILVFWRRKTKESAKKYCLE